MPVESFVLDPAFIEAIPKTDLHLHLDGSLRLQTLIDLAETGKVELPATTPEELRLKVFKDSYQNLGEYLYPFKFTTAVMQTPEALERVAYELAWDNINEGVCYIEVRFAPQLHINGKQDIASVLLSVDMGLRRAKAEYNQSIPVTVDGKPEFEYGIIVCALRKFSPTYSKYYERLFNLHPYSRERDLYTMASLDLARAAVQIRDKFGIPVVGFDLAGEEAGYPAEHHIDAFELAHRHFLKKTVHAGEAYGPESIFQAITDLKADRIGHGYYLFQVPSIKDHEIVDKERFVRDLAGYIADRRITIEVCLTSNLQTNPRIGDLQNHAFARMREAKLSTTFCTDNRTVSNTTVSREIQLAIQAFKLTAKELRHIIVYGFKRSFFPRPYIEKRSYVRGAIDYYDRVQRRYQGAEAPDA